MHFIQGGRGGERVEGISCCRVSIIQALTYCDRTERKWFISLYCKGCFFKSNLASKLALNSLL
jgi:hypothetical protein